MGKYYDVSFSLKLISSVREMAYSILYAECTNSGVLTTDKILHNFYKIHVINPYPAALFLFFHLKLESLPLFPALNDEKYPYL